MITKLFTPIWCELATNDGTIEDLRGSLRLRPYEDVILHGIESFCQNHPLVLEEPDLARPVLAQIHSIHVYPWVNKDSLPGFMFQIDTDETMPEMYWNQLIRKIETVICAIWEPILEGMPLQAKNEDQLFLHFFVEDDYILQVVCNDEEEKQQFKDSLLWGSKKGD